MFNIGSRFFHKIVQINRSNGIQRTTTKMRVTDPICDTFEKSTSDFNKIEIDEKINSGRQADVYTIKGHPEWVLRHVRGAEINLATLEKVNEDDDFFPIVAKNGDETLCILKRKEGTPLFQKDWRFDVKASPEVFFAQTEELLNIPDSSFVQYYRDVLNLRRNGYQIDTFNPNNILYDPKTQSFNIVDYKKGYDKKPIVEMDDFYVFLDERKSLGLYEQLDEKNRAKYKDIVKKLLDKIINALQKEGINLNVEDINPHSLQSLLVYIYHNDEAILALYD